MKFLKQAVKKYLRKSKFFKKIIKKLNEVARQEDPSIQKSKAKSTSKNTSNASSGRGKDVIYPLIKEYKYNKRIYNYLLENQDGYPIKKWVIEQMYYSTIGRFPNLDHPQSLNEKMQWMRLHYHDPLMVKCVDKCSFKDYIKEHVGEEYVVPLYGVWENVNDIDFEALPDKFAIKSTWGWGDLQNILVKNKSALDLHKTKSLLSNWLMPWNNYYYQSFEWDSKDIPPRIIAEQLLEPECGEIIDYKFYCYNGICRHFLVCSDRKTKTKYTNYDMNMNCMKLSPNSHVTDQKFEKPPTFSTMLHIAEELAKPFPLVRVDFYDIDGRIYVGELTFSPGGGFNTYYEEWDNRLGSFLMLPEANVAVNETPRICKERL